MTNKPQFVGGCRRVKLNEICSKGKSSLRQKDVLNDGPYNVYGASGVVGTTSDYQNEIPYVAVVKDGAGVGRANACEPMTSILGTMQALIPKPNVERDYLLYLVRSLRLGEGFSGSTIPHIYFKDYGRIEVPLPSLEAQKQIVSQLGLVEAQIAQAEAQIKQLDQLVKSRFVEMFGNPALNPMKWDVGTIESCCVNLDSQRVPITQGSRIDGPYPYIGASGVVDHVANFIFDETLLLISEDGANLLARTSPIAFTISGKSWVNNHAHVLRCRDDETRVYLQVLINMLDISSYVSGSAQPKLSQKQMNRIPIMLPNRKLLVEFADFASQVDKSRFVAQQQIEKLQMLYDSLAQEYFGD